MQPPGCAAPAPVFLDDGGYRALAEEPHSEAMATYRRTEGRTTFIVLIVVVVMLTTSAFEAGWLDAGALRSWLAMAGACAPVGS